MIFVSPGDEFIAIFNEEFFAIGFTVDSRLKFYLFWIVISEIVLCKAI